MIQLNLTTPIIPTVEISGNRFPVQLSELDINALLEQVKNNALDLKNKPNTESVLAYLRQINEAIDAILGEGAMAKLANGRSINAATALRWLREVAGAALQANMEAVKAKND